MKIKTRKLLKGELDLWKRVTQNDTKLKTYLNEDKTLNDSFRKEERPLTEKPSKIKDVFIKNKNNSTNKLKREVLQSNRKTISKLERGKLKPEAFMDLHGYNKINAKVAVLEFIKKSIFKEIRCILIITGKKSGYMGATGVLRKSLPMWLKEKEFSSYILGHNYASSKDGGDGARYVLLRKKDKVLENE